MKRSEILAEFTAIARARDWQDLHTPKNLAIAVAVEAAELLTEFNWRDEPDEPTRKRIAGEIADVYCYLIALADRLGIDWDQALVDKIDANRQRFLSPDAEL